MAGDQVIREKRANRGTETSAVVIRANMEREVEAPMVVSPTRIYIR